MSEPERKRGGPLLWLADRSRRFWIIAAAMLPVAYVASFGPAVWLASRGQVDKSTVIRVCQPLIWLAVVGPAPIRKVVHWWGSLGVPSGKQITFAVAKSHRELTLISFGEPFVTAIKEIKNRFKGP